MDFYKFLVLDSWKMTTNWTIWIRYNNFFFSIFVLALANASDGAKKYKEGDLKYQDEIYVIFVHTKFVQIS